jgi:hypothetical protein
MVGIHTIVTTSGGRFSHGELILLNRRAVYIKLEMPILGAASGTTQGTRYLKYTMDLWTKYKNRGV